MDKMNIVYVSSSSAESIENGTEQYPYKSVQTAFSYRIRLYYMAIGNNQLF